MGLLVSHEAEDKAATEKTCLIVSAIIIVYSLGVLDRGLKHFRDSNYLSYLLAGFGSKLPRRLQVISIYFIKSYRRVLHSNCKNYYQIYPLPWPQAVKIVIRSFNG